MSDGSAIRLAGGPPISELEEVASRFLADVRSGAVSTAAIIMVSPDGQVGTVASGPAVVPLGFGATMLQLKMVELATAPAKSSLVRARGLPS